MEKNRIFVCVMSGNDDYGDLIFIFAVREDYFLKYGCLNDQHDRYVYEQFGLAPVEVTELMESVYSVDSEEDLLELVEFIDKSDIFVFDEDFGSFIDEINT